MNFKSIIWTIIIFISTKEHTNDLLETILMLNNVTNVYIQFKTLFPHKRFSYHRHLHKEINIITCIDIEQNKHK